MLGSQQWPATAWFFHLSPGEAGTDLVPVIEWARAGEAVLRCAGESTRVLL